MGKFISVTVAIILQIIVLFLGHIYYTSNPRKVAIVVEAAYGLNQHQTAMNRWIDEYMETSKYYEIYYGTDKSYLGTGSSNKDSLFRVNFGTINMENLDRTYPADEYYKRYLLVFSENIKIKNWEIVEFK